MTQLGHNGGPPLVPLDPKAAGWIAAHRDIRDHPLVGFGKPVKPADPKRGSHSRNEAWTDLIMECRYQEGRVLNGGRLMTIYAGEMIGAVSWLAHRWNWTPAAVRWFLNQLEDDGMITRSQVRPNGDRVSTKNDNVKGKQAAIITVCNYVLYQMSPAEERQSERQSNNNETTMKQQRNDNNNKEEQGNKGTKNNTGPSAADVRWAHGRWNDMAAKANLPPSPSLSDNTAKSIKARLREHGRQGWEQALTMVYRSAFLRGRNERGFTATLPWFVGPKNFDKVVSGTYGNGAIAEEGGSMSDAERAAKLRMMNQI